MNILKKAFYFGVGLISLAGEKATDTIGDLRDQTLKLADELVKRGELTAEEAKRFVDEVMDQTKSQSENPPTPRTIEILDANSEDEEIQKLKETVKHLQTELASLSRP